jgi:hypothetical protein
VQLHAYDQESLQITLFSVDDEGQHDSGFLLKTILLEIYLQWHCETSEMEKQEFLIKIFQSYHEKC